ncbi:HlyD family type I secretion periplasmic adaptor subunit [Candidatus Nitrospira neomarina]|uniref:HlyD family type I secretion periplasmic adaptor subunit n=1 Tax=Candidatus Nitrospira neomarina TaxID=3020899 RepID=A0AA96JWI7_9BACT|nr:HlyD family type I secretion periplasmic adaptor subunit [Candidatus Nitrospira neomarina]WNM62100.1 HlyD family type I secretion periplasmic adaptor subunit [Candidatus Nitrospira neomarina]
MDRQIVTSLNRHIAVGLLLILILVGGVGGWAAVEEISGAVIAPGIIVVETKAKRVQHQEGGIIKEIRVQAGDLVKAGDLVVKLDDTVVQANLSMIMSELGELEAQEVRLIAERDGHAQMHYSSELMDRGKQEPAIAGSLSDQRALREARGSALQGRKAQLNEQIAQLEDHIRGLAVQRSAKTESIQLINERLEALEPLLLKGLVLATEVTILKRDRAELVGDRGGLVSQIAQAHETISERRLHIIQIEDEFRSAVLEDLQVVRARIAQLHEEQIAALDKLRRVEIRAPRTGYIHQLNVHTVGGVVGAGETLMLIVPREDVLIVEAQLQPTDVDQVQAGQAAIIRLPGFNQRTTPELTAHVTTISADLTRDEVTGTNYYLAQLLIGDRELTKLEDKKLVPGMPIEAFIQTGERTILSYLVKPMTDHIAHAFKE